jgi:hypothetical protein
MNARSIRDADLTPQKLDEFIDVAGSAWMTEQLAKYSAFRQTSSPNGHWSHRPPMMSPVIPLVYWGSRELYLPTNEMPMGYWFGEPKSILGHLATMLIEFSDYWKSLPKNIGLKNIRWFLRTPGRFASFEHEIRTASTYMVQTPYQVEPRFFDPGSGRGEPDIVLTKNGKKFNVQCKAMDPTKSSDVPFDLFEYLVGCIGRLCQDYDCHGYLTMHLQEALNKSLAKTDMDYVIDIVRELLKGGGKAASGVCPGGKFTFNSSPSKKSFPQHLWSQFTMWQGSYLFRERRTIRSGEHRKSAVACSVMGGKFPSFESYLYPKLEEAARDAPKTDPLIICLHLYPPVPVYDYQRNSAVQKRVIPALERFFERNRHVCLILISSNAQLPIPLSSTKQTILTPAWEVESQYWSGERPDYYSAKSLTGLMKES